MAARLNKRHTESVLQRIKTSQLVNRLQDHGFGKIDLTRTQVDSIKFLVERTLAKAEAPKDLNLNFAGCIEVEFV